MKRVTWKKLSVGKRMSLGFGIVLVLLLLMVMFNNQGVRSIVTDARQVIDGNKLLGFINEKEIDHMTWAADVNALLTDENVTTLEVETDDHLCSLGKWLYGEGRQNAEALVPSLAPHLKAIELPHQKLHAAASRIKEMYTPADPRLPSRLVEQEVVLLKWTAQIRSALAQKSSTLGVPLDPAKSELGKWLQSEKGKAAHGPNGEALISGWEQLIADQVELFETATYIQDNMTGFKQLESAAAEKKSVTQEWNTITDAQFALIQVVREKIVSPAKAKAMISGNYQQVNSWLEVDKGLDKYFVEPLLTAGLAVAQVAAEDSAMLPSILDANREKVNAGLSTWKILVADKPVLWEKTDALEEQTGQWIVGGLKYAQAAMKEASAQATIDDAYYTYENELQPKLLETLTHMSGLKKVADEAVANLQKVDAIYTSEVVQPLDTIRALFDKIRTEAQKHIVTDSIMLKTAQTVRTNVLWVGVIAAAISIAAAFLIIRSIVGKLRQISRHVDKSAKQVTAASSQVSSASQSVAEGASEQASTLEETSASLEDLSAMTHRNADSTQKANQLMANTQKTTRTANDSMDKLEESMSEISEASEEMSKIINTIDEIAFQTNLLALNAAVEAARAGEAGAGFAVVADEVRALALRSAQAAKDTTSLIENTNQKIVAGAQLMKKTNADFDVVEEGIHSVSDIIKEISGASKDQTQGIEQVNTAVAQIDTVTQQNAASAEESASSAEEMHAQAEEMKGVAQQLKRLVGEGRKGGRRLPGKRRPTAIPDKTYPSKPKGLLPVQLSF
jgi:methyl-accepting chemotaxis protein